MGKEKLTDDLCRHFLCIHFHFIEVKKKKKEICYFGEIGKKKRPELGVQNEA